MLFHPFRKLFLKQTQIQINSDDKRTVRRTFTESLGCAGTKQSETEQEHSLNWIEEITVGNPVERR